MHPIRVNDISHYVHIIAKRWSAVLSFALITFAAIITFTLTQVPLYKASAKLIIEKVEPFMLFNQWSYYNYDPEFYTTQNELIQSKPVADKVVANMISNSIFYNYYFGPQKGVDVAATHKSDKDEVARRIASEVDITSVPDSRIVFINYYCDDPEIAAIVVNALTRAYVETTVEMRLSSSGDTLKWITGKLNEEKARLNTSETELQNYLKDNDIVVLENQLSVLPESLSEISSLLTKADAEIKDAEVSYEAVAALPASLEGAESIPVVADDPVVMQIRQDIVALEQKITENSRKYGAKHHIMVGLDSEMEALKDKLHREMRRVIETIRRQYEQARSKRDKVKSMLSDARSEALSARDKFIRYDFLKREVETNRQIYDSLFAKMKEQSITTDIQKVSIWVVEQAEPPQAPVKPNKRKNIILGLLISILGAFGFALLLEYTENTIMIPEDAEKRLHVPVLGTVFYLKPTSPEATKNAIELVIDHDPRSIFSENYRALMTSILLYPSEHPVRSVLITSVFEGEGKTATAVNLAIAMAEFGKKVLLIDADMRKPRIHKILGLENKVGLSNKLKKYSTEVINRNVLHNLDVITSGTIPTNPTELIGSERFYVLSAEMKQHYDIVICDSPPILTITDSLLLSKHFDGTALVTRAGKTKYEFAEHGLKHLAEINSRVLGIIINGVKIYKGSSYYKYYSNAYDAQGNLALKGSKNSPRGNS